MTGSPIRWGILSTGRIAGVFAEALQSLDDARLIAVGSRSADAAAAFGDRFNIPRRYASYEELAADPDVDIIYIATPHTLHAANCLLCLRHEKRCSARNHSQSTRARRQKSLPLPVSAAYS